MTFIKIFDNYNPQRKRIIIIVFDDMIVDIMTNEKFHLYLSLSLIFLFQKM